MKPLVSNPVRALAGDIAVPGDKSISHRALLIGALAVGETAVSNLLEGDDVLGLARALGALGVDILPGGGQDGAPWRISGRGVGGLSEPRNALDVGNSGTAARLLAGLCASHDFTTVITGDDSLGARPMERVMAPLRRMGAAFQSRSGGRLPMTVIGTGEPIPIVCELAQASAQVKSAILLAALQAPGKTTVIEPLASRDHTERMLAWFGAEIECRDQPGGGRAITVTGQPELRARAIAVPGDISSAAFPLVAALLVPDSQITLRNIGLNPLRAGLIETLREMGADIEATAGGGGAGDFGAEPIGDLTVKSSTLKGITVPAERAPRMIDEYPVLAVAAALAQGVTRFEGVGELRVKESDRLSAIARGLEAAGVEVAEEDSALVIHGRGKAPAGGATIETHLDHRIAMAFLILGAVSEAPIAIDDGRPIDTSFPGFAALMGEIGLDIKSRPGP